MTNRRSLRRIWALGLAALVAVGAGCRTTKDDSAPGPDGDGRPDVQAGAVQMRVPQPGVGVGMPDPVATGGARPRAADSEQEPGVGTTDNGEAPSSGLGYHVQSGDQIRVFLRGISPPATMDDVIDADGYINMPYLGDIRVAGMTSSEIEKLIHKMYVPDYYRHATVTVVIPTQRSFYVKGYVNAPGRYPYIAGVTLLQALSGAGGPNNYANPKKVHVIRGDERLGPFNMYDIQDDPSQDPIIEPGDVIDVPRGLI